MVLKLTPGKHWYNLDGENELSRQLATSGGREIISVLLTAGGSSAAARIHDSASGAHASKDSFLIAANAGESTPFVPAHPIPFRKGIYIELEQGGPQGAELFIEYN